MHTNYNINQMVLPLTTDYKPKKHHISWYINDLVETLAYETPYIFGRPREYSLSMLLKLVLYAYAKGIYSSRKMEELAEENLPARWLCQEEVPSYRTICRFRVSEDMEDLMNQATPLLIDYLRDHRLISDSVFVDGTKILADANKYSFVWKKNAYRYDEMNRQEIMALLEDIKNDVSINGTPKDMDMSVEDIEEVLTHLEVRLEDLDKEVEETQTVSPNPAKRERRSLKSKRKKLMERKEKMIKYQDQKAIFGSRNSYSKTDKDATFMRMKDDPMQNGQLKPGYNLQIATSNQYILGHQLFPNPTDTRTMIPFMKTLSPILSSMNYVAMDAGYGSESNYRYLEDNHPDLTSLIPYGTMMKEQSKKWKTDEKKVMNWEYNEENDYYVDGEGIRFNFNTYRTTTDTYGFTRDFKEYIAEKYDENHHIIPASLTPKGNIRRIRINPSWEYFKAQQQETLAESSNEQIYAQRKIDVESVFGHMKACLRFHRFSVRGIEKVNREISLVIMALNLRKLRNYTQKMEAVLN